MFVPFRPRKSPDAPAEADPAATERDTATEPPSISLPTPVASPRPSQDGADVHDTDEPTVTGASPSPPPPADAAAEPTPLQESDEEDTTAPATLAVHDEDDAVHDIVIASLKRSISSSSTGKLDRRWLSFCLHARRSSL